MTSKEAPTPAASENTNVGQDDDEGKEDWISLVFQLMRGTHKYQQVGYYILALPREEHKNDTNTVMNIVFRTGHCFGTVNIFVIS